MKAGLVTSTILHAVLLGVGLFSLSAPRAFEVMDVESFPVEIVPIEEISQAQVGEREAPAAEAPAPVPTTRPEPVENAEQVGDNTVDTPAPPTPDPKPRPVETAALPEPAPEPAPIPDPIPEPEPAKPEPKPEPVPATEVTPQPEPPQEVEPDPAPEPEPQPQQEAEPEPSPEPVPAEAEEAQEAALPESAPRPEARPRPQPAQAQTAKTPERKDAEEPSQKQAQAPAQEKKSDDLLQDVAALLNKDKASGGGAKRSTQEAALGGKRKTGEKLSQSELDALRNQFSGCWSIPAGAEGASDLRASIRFNVAPGGRLEGMPEVIASSGNRQFDESAVRAVQKCDQRGFILPQGKEDVWAEVVVNFDPTDMF